MTATVYQVVRWRVCDPWPEHVLEIAVYDNADTAMTVARSWSWSPAVQSGRERVKVRTL